MFIFKPFAKIVKNPKEYAKKRSFTPFRMTIYAKFVILSAAKNLNY